MIIPCEQVSRRVWRPRTPCAVCGRILKRDKTFRQTVNPANRNPDGTVKTREQVWAAVCAEAEAWAKTKEPVVCSKCEKDYAKEDAQSGQ